LLKSAPLRYTDLDVSRLGSLYHDWELALSDDVKAAAEHKLFAEMHRIGERQRKAAAAAWVRITRQECSLAEFQLLLKFAPP
jgi:hypothetical protein